MDGRIILGAFLGLVVFLAGQRGVRWAIRRTVSSREARIGGTWQYDVAKQASSSPRFEANAYFNITGGIIGICVALAAVFSAVPVWVGALGLAMVVLAVANVESWLRYGDGRHAGQVMRGWLRL